MTNPTIKKILSGVITSRKNDIEDFFAEKYATTKPLFYSSVDVRYSGFKIVPVDTNLFPAGFNLLSSSQSEKASAEVKNYLDKYYPGKKKLLLVPENHTRNKYYLLNVYRLSKILENAGLEVKIGRIIGDEKLVEETLTGEKLELLPITKNGNRIEVEGFVPDIVIANNDFSSGKPEILKALKCQPIIPPVSLGWFKRRKSQHFETYDSLIREFAAKFGLDYWQVSAMFKKCGKINFKTKEGLDHVASQVDLMLATLGRKYKEHGVEEDPYVFIKANNGTYGMGIMVVKSAQEILDINKKARHSMNIIKEGVENSEVVIQEGIPTIDQYNGNPAEPMIYLVNANSVGCTYRVNHNQDKFGNLNSSGMEFVSFESMESGNEMDCPVQCLIARLASLAAARECYEENWEI